MQIDLDLMAGMPNIRTEKQEGKMMIWCIIRKKWLVLQPEELVRQLCIVYLIENRRYNINKIQVEKQLLINGMNKRFDILIYDDDFTPSLLVECKRPDVAIEQQVFDQISLYNIALKAPHLWVSNGMHNYCCEVDLEAKSYEFLATIPIRN